jgi:hypothetical protein
VLIYSTREDVIGKADSSGYSGKFIVYNNWDKSVTRKLIKKILKSLISITQTTQK